MLKLKATMPDWYIPLPEKDRQHLKALVDERWRLQGELDELLVDLQSDIDAFAKPLLKTSLQANFNNFEDPEKLSLVLEVPDSLIFGIDKGATRVRSSSLLAAALHNFEEAETREDAFRSGSGVFRSNPQGTPGRIKAITPARFASLCRRLDIGAQYQTHLQAKLAPTDPVAERTLRERSIASEKAAFRSSTVIARFKGDISVEAFSRLQDIAEGKKELRFHGLPLRNHRLSLMGFRLASIVLFSAVGEPSVVKKAVDALTPASLRFWTDWSRRMPFLPGNAYEQYKLVQAFFANGPTGVADEMLRSDDIYNQSRLTGPLIAYVPDDPDHPLKEYASLTEFMKVLIGQLRDPQYQAFFSQFVAQKDKGHFFARVNERLKTISWHQREPLDMGPWWRETAIENPNAEPITNLIANDLWLSLFLERRAKVLLDARYIAVPTGDEDATSRWKRLTSYRSATTAQKKILADSHTRFRESLNQIETRLGRIKDVFEFAEQPLRNAIKAQFKLDLDVRNVYFARKYGFKDRDDFYGFLVFEQQNTQSLRYEYRGISLLEAALANFEPDEEQPSRCNDCQLITGWSSYDGEVLPTFEAVNSEAKPVAPHDFAKLCRTLDLGALYQKHIKDIVEPETADERLALALQLEEHQRRRLALSTELAWLQSGISRDAYQMLKKVLTGDSGATLDGRPVTFATVQVFGIELVGPLLIGPNRRDAGRVERLTVYLPNDPQQPLKEYPSSADFMADLRTRLHSSAYRRFFSQFVPVRQQGIFFAQFNKLYNPSSLGAQADYSLQSRPVRLPLDEAYIEGELWKQLRLKAVARLYADARAIAVPTGDEDRDARTARLASYLDAVVSVFNLAAFVVPGLGPIMLTVGAAQMLDDAFEGIEAYEQGEPREMWAHFSSVALNVAFIGAGAAVLPNVHLSTSVDNLKLVTLPDGRQKLWNPDLSRYESLHNPAPETVPDGLGLYSHNGQMVLSIDGDQYQVKQDPVSEQFRIQHPTRPKAYSPELFHNGEGAWRHELERPQTWEGAKLMRRLGPLVEGFSDAELEQIRRVSGIDTDVLRRLHAESETMPAILSDTVKRFRAYGDAVRIAQGIDEGSLSAALCSYAASLAVELPGWPANKAIEAFSGAGLGGPSVKYGMPDALAQDIIKVSRVELMSGRLPARIIESFNEADVKSLLPQYTPGTPEERISTLRKQLQQQAIKDRARLMRSLYAEQQQPADAAVTVVQRDFTGVPSLMIRELLADTTPTERATLATHGRVPLRVAEGVRRLQQQIRLTRAYEGLYFEELIDKDTEILAINSLRRLPGWVNGIRLEIREGALEGGLRASVGPEDAGERKVLVRVGEGRYEARNDRDEHLHGTDNLYASIQHALSDRHRQAIGLPHVSQGTQLKTMLIEHQLSRAQLRPLLRMQPRKQPFFKSPMRLSGERIGYPLSDHPRTSQWQRIVEERVRTLYPALSPAQLNGFIESMGDRQEATLITLEREFKQLDHTLQNWQRTQLDVPPGVRQTADFAQQRRARLTIIKALKQAWQRTGEVDLDINGQPQGQFIDLSSIDLQGQLDLLPPLTANFDHVTHLDLSGASIDVDADGFLRHFRRLRRLNLSSNGLFELPVPLDRMSHLTELDLSDNLIELDPSAVTRLRGLARLQFLGLEGNPLRLSPDVGQMPDLTMLLLADTGLNAWPVGLFDQHRGPMFNLDLSANVLEHIPQVEPGSDGAEVVARTTISQEPRYISEQNLQMIRDYRQSVGLEPDRPYPPRGILDSIQWRAGLTDEQWRAKQDAWDSLEHEHGSEPFFRELRKLAQSADALATEKAARAELCSKVWEMIEAATANSTLRKVLFRMAAAPTTCVDAGAQLFNAMGLEVLIFQAYELGAHDLIETALLELARGKSRLDELGRIARERIGELLGQGRQFPQYDEQGLVIPRRDAQGQVIADIDEVEIHMIYPTQLAQRLELPWQSRKMMFRVPDVTREMIQRAYTRVLEKEQGALLQERILEQPFWVNFMMRSNPEPLNALRAKAEISLDLQAAQQAWIDSDSSVHKIYWRGEVVRLGKLLGKPDSEISPGMVMSDAQYYADMETIAVQEKELVRKLTHEAMQRARLQRSEMAFRVEGDAHAGV
ncbi:hypothetical protein DKY63_22555 [Pseudomonas putida]|uniref:RING-type E3 ubiquitin transferase n=2 Tax=Pseudomonas putida TaxID=303 RepID=A0A2Z4RNM6_PSEPU|nr:hypothetical protein DKY63_22555 [Pseudomonas putida]